MVREWRNKAPPEEEPPGDGGPVEAACYIAEAVPQLVLMARRHHLDTLAFLLDMAKLEADEVLRSRLSKTRG